MRRASWPSCVLALSSFFLPWFAHAESPSQTALSAAVVGELLTHPGVALGFDHPVLRRPVGGGEGAVFVAEHVAGYWHVDNHVALRADVAVGARLTTRSRVLVEASAGAGYLHTFLAAPTYGERRDGTLGRVTDPGRPAFMPTVALGTGVDLGRVSPFLRLEGFGQFPFEHHLLPHAALWVGARVGIHTRRTP